MKKLENKVAVVYGDGTTGGAIAKAFAREGAKIFLTSRTLTKLDADHSLKARTYAMFGNTFSANFL